MTDEDRPEGGATRTAGERVQLVRQADQAERTAAGRREVLKQHDRAVSSLKAGLASLAEPEAEPEAA